MRRTLRPILWTFGNASCPAAITRRRCAALTSPRRMARSGRSASRPSKTRWRSGRSPWCWKQSTKRNFLPCSYGFRPGRSAHQALRELFGVITRRGQYWVIEVEVRKYFDSIPHSELRAILDQRVTDGVIRRMIDKWLNAGVLEKGSLPLVTEGTPQDDAISTLL